MPGYKYSTEAIIRALQATNGLISLAAKTLGCTPQTIYNRANTTKSVQEAIELARLELVDQAELALRAAVLGREPWAVALVLKTLGKNRGFVERTELTGKDGEPVKLEVTGDDLNQARRMALDLEARLLGEGDDDE